MMNRVLLSILLAIFTLNLVTVTAYTQSDEDQIRSLLESRDNEIKELVGPEGTELSDVERERLKNIVNDIIDFESMARFSLGATWERIEREQQEEFVSLFMTIVRDHSLNRLEIYRADVIYESISAENGTARVETIAAYDNNRIPVGYTMESRSSGWVITDMYIDEVSTAESYRTQFQSIIRQRGFDTLMNTLRKRAERT